MTAGIFWPRTHYTEGGGTTPPASTAIIGVNQHMDWAEQSNDATRQALLDKAVSWGATSIRLDYAWASFEATKGSFNWTELDEYIDEADARGLSVLLMLYWPPSWSSGTSSKPGVPSNPVDYGNAIGRAAARYGSKLCGIEMWNEPDLTNFWSGTRTQFFNLLAGAYPVAKALSPSTTFIAGSPTYLGLATGWFSEAYTHSTYRPGQSYDAQAIHPYLSPSDLPANAPKTNWSIRGIEDLIALRTSKGDTSPLWATEFGWSTHTNTGSEANYQRGVTEAQQAAYTVDAYSMLAGYGMKGIYVYTDMDYPSQAGAHEQNFGLLHSDRSEKPVVTALRNAYAPTTSPPTAAVVGGSSYANIGGAGVMSLTMSLPTGLQDGDEIFIAAICVDTNAGCAITEDKTGWTTVTAKADVGTMQRVLYRATYSASLVAPSWTLSTARKVAYACVAIRNGKTPQESHADGGGLTSTAPSIASAPAGLGLRFYVRKDNLSTSVTPAAGMTQITGALGLPTGPSAHVLAYTTDQTTAGAMPAAATTWPITSVNSTAWTIAV